MDTAAAQSTSQQPAVFEDGLGKRYHRLATRGEPVEILELREEFGTDAFERALRERVTVLSAFHRTCFSQVYAVQRTNLNASTMFVVSDRVPGVRLSTVLAVARQQLLPLEMNANLCLIRQLVTAIALLHEKLPGISHGAIALERVLITPKGRLVVADHALGSAIEQLNYWPERYWKDLRVALPPGAEPAFDQRADVMQIGIIALELILGRCVDKEEYPDRIKDLTERAWTGLNPPPAELRTWLLRMLQLDTKGAFTSAVDAWADLERVIGAGHDVASLDALESFMVEYTRRAPAATAATTPSIPVPPPMVAAPPAAPSQPPPIAASAPAPSVVVPLKPTLVAPAAPAPAASASMSAAPPASTVISAPPASPMTSAAPPAPTPISAAPPASTLISPAPPATAPHPVPPSGKLRLAEPPPPQPVPPSGTFRLAEPLPAPQPVPSSGTFRLTEPLPPPPAPSVTAHPPADADANSVKPRRRGRGRWVAAAAVLVLLAASGAVFGRKYLLPPAAAEAPGTLVVNTTPAGVPVIVDGQHRGFAPLTVELAAGMHELKLAPETGDARIIPFTLTAGSTVAQTIELPKTAPLTGQLVVRSEPAGARVTIDGTPIGTAPLTVEHLTPGTHNVTLQGSENSVTHEVKIEAGATASLVVPMAAAPGVPVSGWISVEAPAEVQVFEDARLLGTSKSDRIMVLAGRHELSIVNETLGYRATRTATVSPGKVSSIRLEWPNGSMAINAQPWADVWVDGEKKGETPIGNVSVPIGTHVIVFRHPELGERTVRATVTVSTPARVSVDMRKP